MYNNKVLILDVSFYQDDDTTPQKIDFVKMKTAGADGVILRCGQNTWLDEDFMDYKRDAKSAGIPFGVYWYWDSRSSPEAQANLLLSALDSYPELGIWGDYEERYGGVYGGFANFSKFMSLIEAKYPNRVGGIYSAYYYWLENTTPTEREYAKRYSLWVANYYVSSPLIPYPWSSYIMWQFTDLGDGAKFGVESKEVDMNYFYGTLQEYYDYFHLETPDTYYSRFDGVAQTFGNRYGCNIYVTKIDPKKIKRIEVKNEYKLPSDVCNKYLAQVAWNGDDWNKTTLQVTDNDSPSFMVLNDGTIKIGTRSTTPNQLYHSSGLRYLVDNGINKIPTTSTDPKYTERHARSIMGMDSFGNIIHLTVDGDYIYAGMTLYECAQTMLEFGATVAFDQGGGGDSVEVLDGNVMNVPDDEYNGIHYERKVPQTILIYAQETNMTNGLAKEALGNVGKIRNKPSRYGTEVGIVNSYQEVEFVEVVPVQVSGPADLDGELWFSLPDGNFLNYKLFSGGVLKDYFIITRAPSNGTPPNSEVITVTIERDGFKPLILTGMQEPL